MRKIAGVIAEYNPFHNGHLYQLRQIRQMGAEGIVVCMSGNFVQRCSPAISEKHRRALCALEHGADLVLELPFPYSVCSAEGFASAGVSLLSATGQVTDLVFGSETADSSLLEDAYTALCMAEESGDISSLMKTGASFPVARNEAMVRRGLCLFLENRTIFLLSNILKRSKSKRARLLLCPCGGWGIIIPICRAGIFCLQPEFAAGFLTGKRFQDIFRKTPKGCLQKQRKRDGWYLLPRWIKFCFPDF